MKQDEGGSMLKPDIYRLLSVIEAIAIIDHLTAVFAREAEERDAERRRNYIPSEPSTHVDCEGRNWKV